MCRVTRGGTAGLVAIALALAVVSLAAAARSWRTPVALGPGAFAQVEQDAAGRATAIWIQGDDVRSSTRIGGAWSRPVTISGSAFGPNLPRLAVSAGGVAVAVWERQEGLDYVAQAAVRPSAGAAWLPPRDLSSPSQGPIDVDVAIDSHGNAFTIWHRFEDPDQTVETAFRPAATGVWQSPQEVGAGTATKITMDAAGNAFAVWESQPGSIVQAAVRPASTDSWPPAQTLSEAAYVFLTRPEVSVDAAGNAIVAWWRMRSDQVVALETAFRPASTGAWQSAQTVATAPAYGYVPGISDVHVALAPGANVVATWQRYDGTSWIQAAFRPASPGTWSAPHDVSQPGLTESESALAVDRAGNALVLWSRDRDQIRAAFRAAGTGSWGLPQAVAGSGDVRDPDVAFDAAGNAVAVWHRWAAGGSSAMVESAPFLEAGAPPPPPPPGAPGTCRIPRVVGKTLAAARTAIRRANCSVGRVRRARSRRVRRGRVVSQSPRAGRTVRRGTRVNLVVSRGRRSA